MKYAKALTTVGLLGLTFGLATPTLLGAGADIQHSGLSTSPIANFGPVNVGGEDIYAYILGSNTCNIGNAFLLWTDNGTPALSMNAFRLSNGRLQQIGVGMTKTACCVSNSPVCGASSCSGPGGTLMAGCQDTYSASWNSLQSNLKPRSRINAFTGAFSGATGVSSSNVINGRLQVKKSDMNPANYPNALFFVEGQYICTEDATNGNWANNASYSRVTVNASYQYAPTGTFNIGKPAIYAWREHGLGAGVTDPNVVIQAVDIPGEGRFLVASKITQTTRNTWRYEYAIQNFNSDRAASSFRVPVPTGASVTNTGFSDVWYHGEDAIYDGTDWNMPVSAFEQR